MAAQVAKEWFDLFADTTDAEGRVLHPDWNGTRGPVAAFAIGEGSHSPEEVEANERRYFSGWSDAQKRDFLMRFSDLHLALVALASHDAFERMRLARGISIEAAERSRKQMLRITEALMDSGTAT